MQTGFAGPSESSTSKNAERVVGVSSKIRIAAALKEIKRGVEFVRERRKKLQGFFKLWSGTKVFFFFRNCRGSCRVSVRDGRQELQQVFRECRGEFPCRKELLIVLLPENLRAHLQLSV